MEARYDYITVMNRINWLIQNAVAVKDYSCSLVTNFFVHGAIFDNILNLFSAWEME